jgi:hypothetical protein
MLTVKERIDGATATMPDIGVSWVELMTTIPQLMPSGVLPVYRPSEIVYGGKRYILREPLECEVYWDEEVGDFLWIEYAPLGLHSTGYTLSEAIERFNMKFALDYIHFNRRGEGGLGTRLGEVLRLMNKLVIAVEDGSR